MSITALLAAELGKWLETYGDDLWFPAYRELCVIHAKAKTSPQPAEATITPQELWEAVAGNPGITPTKDEALQAAKACAEAVDERVEAAEAAPVVDDRAYKAVREIADLIQAEAFAYPTANTHTPRIMELCQRLKLIACATPPTEAASRGGAVVEQLRRELATDHAEHPYTAYERGRVDEKKRCLDLLNAGQSGAAVQPRVMGKGFERVNGEAVPTVLVGFPVEDWKARDAFASELAPFTAAQQESIDGKD